MRRLLKSTQRSCKYSSNLWNHNKIGLMLCRVRGRVMTHKYRNRLIELIDQMHIIKIDTINNEQLLN